MHRFLHSSHFLQVWGLPWKNLSLFCLLVTLILTCLIVSICVGVALPLLVLVFLLCWCCIAFYTYVAIGTEICGPHRPRPLTSNIYIYIYTTAYPRCDGHSISISACGVWGVRARVQISRKEFHTHIHLDYARVEFYLV